MAIAAKKKLFVSACSAFLIGLLLAIVSGCGGQAPQQNVAGNDKPAPAATPTAPESAPAKALEPVTLTMITVQPLTDEELDKYILQPLHKKYPHITLKRIVGDTKKFVDMHFAGETPDILYTSPYLYRTGVDDYPRDLAPLVKQFNMDLKKFNPVILDSVKKFGKDGQIISIPFVKNTAALFYNKDMFDRFGVEFPKDGMSWDAVAELTRKLQGKIAASPDGTSFRALDPYYNNATNMGVPLSLNVYDPKSGKAVIDEKWKKVFEFMMNVYNIPGNKPAKLASNTGEFVKGNIAMIPQFYNTILDQAVAGKIPFNWDIAQYPDFPEAKGLTYQVDYHQFVVSSISKHPEDAFRVIEVATAPEVQLAAAKLGKIPAQSDPALFKPFGSEVPALKGKNIQGMFKSKDAAMIQPYLYNDSVINEIQASFNGIFNGTTDINTALRTAEEKANAAVAALKSGK
jgi:multiple sugar transport system substrate-binding protein